eukprot:m.870784 g.870784  ORF g.870784 m.870784 type:complete len:338 (-) comp59757_c0_seq5:293-1306(-)
MILSPTTGVPSAIGTYAPNLGNQSNVALSSCSPTSGSSFDLNSNATITCTAVGTSGASASCNFTIRVVDTTPPVVTCPADMNVAPNPGTQIASVIYAPPPNATDGAGIQTLTCFPPTGSQFATATANIVTCTAVDNAGLSANCSFTVNVKDVIPPVVTCPNDILAPDLAKNFTAVTFTVNATDNVQIISQSCTPASGSVFYLGSTIVMCTATDAVGNSANCSFRVTVRDLTPPVITCSSNISTVTAPDSATALVNWPAPAATDAGGIASLTCSPTIGTTIFNVGATLVTCTAIDVSSNQAACNFTVSVLDNQNPEISCPTSYSDTLPQDANDMPQTS